MVSVQTISEPNIVPLTSFSELCAMAFRYTRNTHSLEEITSLLSNHYISGYEAWIDGEIKAFAYSQLIDGIFTMDGHNEGIPVFTASKMGKMVCNDLFASHTDVIYSVHDTDERHLHTMLKRIGFTELGTFGDRTAFAMEKSWVK